MRKVTHTQGPIGRLNTNSEESSAANDKSIRQGSRRGDVPSGEEEVHGRFITRRMSKTRAG